MASGALKKKSRIVKTGDNRYDYSDGLKEYRNGFGVKQIDGRARNLANSFLRLSIPLISFEVPFYQVNIIDTPTHKYWNYLVM